MRFFNIVIATLLSVMTICSCSSTTFSEEMPYNLKRAYEVLNQNGDEEQALDLLHKQLESTPENVPCMMLICRIYRNQDEPGYALSYVNRAIKVNKPKESGIEMSTLYWWKASIYDEMGDDDKEIDCLYKALKLARRDNVDSVQEISFDLGQALYESALYDKSDEIYYKMIKEDETDQAALVGLARNMIEREEYEEAVKLLDRSEHYGEEYSGTYQIRTQAYDKLGEIDKSIDDAILWFEKDEDLDDYPEYIVSILAKHKSYAVAKIKSKMNDSDRNEAWLCLLSDLYHELGDYESSIAVLDQLEDDYGKDEYFYLGRAECYDELGLSQIALEEVDKALELCDDYYNNCEKGKYLRNAGRYSEAIEVFDKAIELEPTSAFPYYSKGWCYELSGDDDKAMELYNQGIDIDKNYAYIYLMRGELYQKRGEKALADADFEKVLELDTDVSTSSCRQYALYFLGKESEAEEWMQKIIDDYPNDSGNYYDKACLYSRMGKLDESVKALETSLEKGFAKFAHIEHDDDLDPVKDRDDYKALISKYKAKLVDREKTMAKCVGASYEMMITEVPISKHQGGTFDVNCSVNGLNLNMIFDTGASDVTISKVEADFMLKNNYISKSDIKGKKYYQIADGGLTEGTVLTLKEVKIGDAVLHNVEASVVKSQNAPLLLGESVLQKFGTFTVDNINEKLVIKH